MAEGIASLEETDGKAESIVTLKEADESWVRYHDGIFWYSAAGTRDVLIFESKETENQDVVPRKEGKLSENDMLMLTSERIPSVSWNQDGALMLARYEKDTRIMRHVYRTNELHMMKKKIIEEEIKNLHNNTVENGVTIHYIGPGRKYTGDWCFSDGFITFEDMAALYLEHFKEKRKTLIIAADCSYSGNWVEACKQFLDRQHVQPCGHSGRAKKIHIKVFCSCQHDEIGSTLLYSARANTNDKVSGAKYVVTDKEIAPGQTTCFVDSTKIFCNKKPKEQCELMPTFTFKEKKRRERIIDKYRETDEDGKDWRVILLEDNPDNIRTFKEMTREENARYSHLNMRDYGRISRGKVSLQYAKEWILRMKNGLQDINDTDFL